MLRDLVAVFVLVICLNILQVFAPCPFGHNPAMPKQPGSEARIEISPEKRQKFEKELIKERIRVMINSTDTDGDGKATVDELTVWTLQSIKSNHDEEASQRLKNMDKNGDRKVSLEEYLQSAQKIEGDNPERRFNQADEDHDGKLTREEVRSMFRPEDSPHMFDVVAEEYLQKGDGDKDGFIALDEYKNNVMKSTRENEKVAKDFFDRQDKDQDGRISKEEIKEWLSSVNSAAIARKETKNLVDNADDNKDGALSEEEALNHIDLFSPNRKNPKRSDQQKSKDEL